MYEKDITTAIIESVASFAAEWWKSKILENLKNEDDGRKRLILSLLNKEIKNTSHSCEKFKDGLKNAITKMLMKHGDIDLVLSTDSEPVGILGDVARQYGMDNVGCFPEKTTMIVSIDYIACRENNNEINYIYKSRNKENGI